MEQRLDCGHTVDVQVGTRLWAYYDASFGVVVGLGHEEDSWHDFYMDGSPFKAAGSPGYYNSQRLACLPCGLQRVRESDHLAFPEGSPADGLYELVATS